MPPRRSLTLMNLETAPINMFWGCIYCLFSANPLEHVTQAFREFLVERALYCLLMPEKRLPGNMTQESEVLLYTQLLAEAAAGPSSTQLTGGPCTETDNISKWWSAILTVGIFWLSGDEDNAERSYSQCDTFPRQLQQSE